MVFVFLDQVAELLHLWPRLTSGYRVLENFISCSSLLTTCREHSGARTA